ncbi:hypothetical protein DVA81_19095, partial [Acinetobacter baumannii]
MNNKQSSESSSLLVFSFDLFILDHSSVIKTVISIIIKTSLNTFGVNTNIKDYGPQRHWDLLNFIGHKSMMARNATNGIDPWLKM